MFLRITNIDAKWNVLRIWMNDDCDGNNAIFTFFETCHLYFIKFKVVFPTADDTRELYLK